MNLRAFLPTAVGLALLAALPAAGQPAAQDAGEVAEDAAEAPEPYRVGPRDVLAIEVFEAPQLDGEVRVNEAGAVRLPLIGDIPVEGLTIPELTERLERVLEDQALQRATVSAEVIEYRSRPISVIGAVKSAGGLPVSGRLTLIEAITAAGGLTAGHGNTVYVVRRAENGLTDRIAIPVRELLVEADPDLNIPIFDNDLINIPAAVEVTIYCLGEVAKPGPITFKSTERITLLSAIARAGGLTRRASNKILIRRGEPDSGGAELEIHYRRVLNGRAPDPPLRQGDVLVVKESFF